MANLNIIRVKELANLLGISIPTLYRWHESGDIPIKKRKFGPRSVGYLESDVEAWLTGELEKQESQNISA